MSLIQMWRALDANRADDNPELSPYAQAMERGLPYIKLTLDVPEAIELKAFVGAFTSVASEFDRYIRSHQPDLAADAGLYVGEVKQGSIIAFLIPFAPMIPDAVNIAAQILTVEDFVSRYGRRLGFFKDHTAPPEDVTKAVLKDFGDQVAAIANHAGSTLGVAAIEIENGEHKVRAAFQFKTDEARSIQDNLSSARRLLDQRDRADHERVLMTFVRSDKRDAPVGKRSGELVEIRDVSDRPLPLIYASKLAEQEIKREIVDDESVYKKGFVVDVNVESRGTKPIAYAVTSLHQVIDLPDDDEG